MRHTQTQIKTGRLCSRSKPSVGDVVLLRRRSERKLDIRENIAISESRDSMVRSANVQLPSGRILGRPLNLLYPLEVCPQTNVGRTVNCPESCKGQMTVSSEMKPQRPVREASRKARLKIIQGMCKENKMLNQ